MLLALFTLYLADQTRRMRLSSDDAMKALVKHAESSASSSHASAEALRGQERATREALEIGHRSAGAAEQLAQANQILATAGQRAWVTVSSVETSILHALFLVPSAVRVIITNTGNTPAVKVRGGVYYCYLDQMTDSPPLEGFGDIESGTLGAHEDGHLPVSFQHDGKVRMPLPGKQDPTAFLYGRVEYKDIFGQGHLTTFAYSYSRLNERFEHCAMHNNVS